MSAADAVIDRPGFCISAVVLIALMALSVGCARRFPEPEVTTIKAANPAELQRYILSRKPDVAQFKLRGPFAVTERRDVEIPLASGLTVQADLYLCAAAVKAPLVIVLHGLDTPTICALNGGAAGYGFDIALGCDIRVAADTAKLAPGFAKRGILPESGGTWLLPRMVGYARAAEIAFTGRTLQAREAHELGLVNRVVPDSEFAAAVQELAAEIAANAPLAVRAIKRMMRAAETETFDQNVHHVFLQLLPLLRTADFREGVTAYMEKRSPKFTGR